MWLPASETDGTITGRGCLVGMEAIMAPEPKRQEPNIPPRKPDIQPEPRPQEIPQDKDVPEKEAPPMQL
jgi:hypothetical protein